MGSLFLPMGWWVLVGVFLFSCICGVKGSNTVEGTVFVDGKAPIAVTSENFVCATLDWWPPDKCDYGICAWDHASLLNLDLKNPLLLNAVKAFSPLKLRLGGTLQDKLIYQTEGKPQHCTSFLKNPSLLFGFTKGCLPLARWDELNSFFNESGALVIFGLNALYGKTIHHDHTATGPWDPTNAASLMRYTVEKGYKIHGWELGNELSGTGIGVRVSADSYASDTFLLHKSIQDIYKGVDPKPLIIAPGGFFDQSWFSRFLAKSSGSIDAISHHIYNLGPGSGEHLIDRILNPAVLDLSANVFSSLHKTLQNSGKRVSAWVGEAGGAYNSGRDGVTNSFVFSFWYLDQLGLASTYDHKVYCRQTLIGGHYGLLNTTTFTPNPDYYSALIWHRLMGRRVLQTTFSGTKMIRAYAHCAKQSPGITLLLINMDGKTTLEATTEFVTASTSLRNRRHHRHGPKWNSTPHRRQQLGEMIREEYHLTPMDGNIQSRTVLLNGKLLTIDSLSLIPNTEAVMVNSSEPIRVAPHSIVFVHMPTVVIPACRWMLKAEETNI